MGFKKLHLKTQLQTGDRRGQGADTRYVSGEVCVRQSSKRHVPEVRTSWSRRGKGRREWAWRRGVHGQVRDVGMDRAEA